MTPRPQRIQRALQHELGIDHLALDQGENDLHHADLQVIRDVAERAIVEDDVQARLAIANAGGGTLLPPGAAAEGLVPAVHYRAGVRRLDAGQLLAEVRALRDLVIDRRRAVLAADLALSREDDARDLVGSEVEQVMNLAVEYILPCLPRDEEVDVTAVGVAQAVAVVH